jgi:hypothetical protein
METGDSGDAGQRMMPAGCPGALVCLHVRGAFTAMGIIMVRIS